MLQRYVFECNELNTVIEFITPSKIVSAAPVVSSYSSLGAGYLGASKIVSSAPVVSTYAAPAAKIISGTGLGYGYGATKVVSSAPVISTAYASPAIAAHGAYGYGLGASKVCILI